MSRRLLNGIDTIIDGVVLAAGDGLLDGDDQKVNEGAFRRVNDAIRQHEYTITLSVGQLTTGVTIPEWTAVLMLSSIKSPALYMQAAFRAQNPCLFQRGSAYLQKENAYVYNGPLVKTSNEDLKVNIRSKACPVIIVAGDQRRHEKLIRESPLTMGLGRLG